MSALTTEVKVGIFVFAAAIILAYMTTQVGKGKLFTGDLYPVVAYFENSSGLKNNAPVEIAGINVGTVRAIELEGNRAKVTLGIKPDVKLFVDSKASIRTRGVLGDKFVEITPGSDAYPQLKAGQALSRSSTPTDMDQLFVKVGQIADDLGKIAHSVSNVLGTPEGEQDMRLTLKNFRETTEGLNELVKENMDSINKIVANMRDFTGDLKDISDSRKENIKRLVDNLDKASEQLGSSMTQMNQVMGKLNQNDGSLGKLVNDKDMGNDLRSTMAQLQSVTRKIDEGKGSLGRLINDDTTSKSLDKALEGINKYLAKQDQFRTSVDFTTEYMSGPGKAKSYLTLKLQPSSDKFYLLSVVDDPTGRVTRTDTSTDYYRNDVYQYTIGKNETKTEKDQLKFSAQLGKRWGSLVLRAGIIESTGGAGAEYLLWDDRVKFFFEAFDFGNKDTVHLKAGAKLYFLKNFYLSGGVDDFASSYSKNRSVFAGAGIYMTDDELKYLLTSAPIPKGN